MHALHAWQPTWLVSSIPRTALLATHNRCGVLHKYIMDLENTVYWITLKGKHIHLYYNYSLNAEISACLLVCNIRILDYCVRFGSQ